ncbi:MAG: 4'-phosphopantetheinyl transferase superfamily protein, partial [Planctomycetota bacterium]
ALRAILGRELGCDPRALAFEEGVHGKPHLAGAQRGALHFNVAHSGERGLIAVARAAPVGVDVEQMRPLEEIAQLAERVLGAAEHARWLALDAPRRHLEFYRQWTLKEAILKACGAGITQTLADIGAERGPLEAPELLRDERGAPRRWSVFQMAAAPGYCAALATQDPGRPILAARTWSGSSSLSP